MKEKVVRN